MLETHEQTPNASSVLALFWNTFAGENASRDTDRGVLSIRTTAASIRSDQPGRAARLNQSAKAATGSGGFAGTSQTATSFSGCDEWHSSAESFRSSTGDEAWTTGPMKGWMFRTSQVKGTLMINFRHVSRQKVRGRWEGRHSRRRNFAQSFVDCNSCLDPILGLRSSLGANHLKGGSTKKSAVVSGERRPSFERDRCSRSSA